MIEHIEASGLQFEVSLVFSLEFIDVFDVTGLISAMLIAQCSYSCFLFPVLQLWPFLLFVYSDLMHYFGRKYEVQRRQVEIFERAGKVGMNLSGI